LAFPKQDQKPKTAVTAVVVVVMVVVTVVVIAVVTATVTGIAVATAEKGGKNIVVGCLLSVVSSKLTTHN
jgi:hypothetical protein